jgi:hypothetical protein
MGAVPLIHEGALRTIDSTRTRRVNGAIVQLFLGDLDEEHHYRRSFRVSDHFACWHRFI